MKMNFEPAIEEFLTQNGTTGIFVVPQYAIGPEGKEPDFVGLDFKHCRIIVAEVSVDYNFRDIIDKFRNRRSELEEPLRRHLASFPGFTAEQRNWPVKYVGFVRSTRLEKAKSEFADDNDVTFIAIEAATFPFEFWGRGI